MKTWKATVVMSYTQDIEVEAESEGDAEHLMRELFDPTRCYGSADCQVYDLKLIKE